MAEGYELAFVIGGLFLSLSAFSLIFGDNYLFRLGASVLSGAISAYICVLLVESYFYPMVIELVNEPGSLSTAQILRAAAVLIGAVLLFCRAYTVSKSGGRLLVTVLMAIAAAVTVLGAAGGTIPAFVRTISGQFRIAGLSPEQRGDVWYWIKACTVLFSAICALLYTRHYQLGKNKESKGSESVFGNVLIGFTFGAITAAIFIAAANILVNHVSGLIGTIQTLVK